MTEARPPLTGRRIFHAAGLPMLLVDPDTSQIEDVNDALCRFYGRTREELIGSGLSVISRSTPERLRDALAGFELGTGQTFAVEHVLAGGRAVPVTVTSAPVNLDGRRLIIEVITERGADRDARADLALMYEAMSDIHRAIVRAKSEAELWCEASRIIVEVAGFPLAWVTIVDEDRRHARIAAAAGGVAFLEDRVDDLTAADATPVARAILEDRTVVHDDIAAQAVGPYTGRALMFGFQSGAAVPMHDGDGPPYGALVVLEPLPAALTPERVALLERLAADLAVARSLMRTSARLRASEERYRSIVGVLQEGVITYDADGRITEVNDAARRPLSPIESVGVGLDGRALAARFVREDGSPWPPDDLPSRVAMSTGRPTERRVIGVPQLDGTVRWVSSSAAPTGFRDDGHPSGTVVSFADVTELREAVARAKASEDRVRTLVDEAFDGVLVIDEQGLILYVNPAAERILEVPHGFIVGRSIAELVPVEIQDQLARDLASIASGTVLEGEYPILRSDGFVLAIEITARNVSARRALQAERDRLAQAAEQASDAISITDAAGIITYVNRAYERMNGYLREEAVGRSAELHLAPEHAGIEELIGEVLATGGVWAGEVTQRAKDGSRFRVSSRVVALRDAAGRVVGRVAIARDISLEHEQDARLAQASRLEAVAQLAGGVAHDLNNVLTMIVGHAALLDPFTSTPADIAEGVRAITEAAGQAEMLTTRLLAFGRRAFLQPRAADLRDLLADTGPILARAVGPRVALAVSPGVDPMPVSLDPNLFEQALLALVVHARDTMPNGGTVRLSVERPAEGEALPGVDTAVLVMSDNGPGLAPETLARLFEPFAAVGDDEPGLGLAMAYGFTEQSGGRLVASSAPGAGTTFRLLLPLATPCEAPARPATDAQPKRTGAATILVAEDEGVLRQVAQRTLVARGYNVLLAASGDEALVVAAGYDGRIDLLFSDVVMPGLRGPGLAAALLRTRPDMRVLLTSGYAADVIGRRGIESTLGDFLPKPYTPSMLAARVAELLAEGGA